MEAEREREGERERERESERERERERPNTNNCAAVLSIGDVLRSRHTSGRTPLHPMGSIGYQFVRNGNLLSSRVLLLLMICQWRGLRWMVEQPSQSLLPMMPRWQTCWAQHKAGSDGSSNYRPGLLKLFAVVISSWKTHPQVYVGSFWMGLFGGPSPKPHRIWSNSEEIILTIEAAAGKMQPGQRKSFARDQLAVHFRDKNGVLRHSGKPKALRASQLLVLIIYTVPGT